MRRKMGRIMGRQAEMMAKFTSTVAHSMMEAIFSGISMEEGSNLTDSTRTTTDATQTLPRQLGMGKERAGNLQNTKHEQADDGHLLTNPQLQMLYLHDWERENTQVNDEMHQDGAKEELGVVDIADLVLDRVIPESLDGYAVEDGHEGPNNEPDY